jgi:hypothetical protein
MRSEGFYVKENMFPDYVTQAQDGGKFVSLTHPATFTPQEMLPVLISILIIYHV